MQCIHINLYFYFGQLGESYNFHIMHKMFRLLSRNFHDVHLSEGDLGLGNYHWILLFRLHTMQRYRSLLQFLVYQPK